MNFRNEGPAFRNGGQRELRQWAVAERLPWLVEKLGLAAGAICASVPKPVRQRVYGLGETQEPPATIDWSKNGIIISPPGTGKGMTVFVEALAYFKRVFVLVPSVIQAHKLEESLDELYHPRLGGCMTSQRKAKGLVQIITTGILRQLVLDADSDLWKSGTVLFVDEAQRIFEQDAETEFMIGYTAHRGAPTYVVSATVVPGTLPKVFGHGDQHATVYELKKEMHPVDVHVLAGAEPFELLCGGVLNLRSSGSTVLVFCGTRREVMALTRRINDDEVLGARAVPVTGNHIVEEQLRAITAAQRTGKPVVVVATPGTMDSSVTIPGLEALVIVDQRVRVDWNEHGVMERFVEPLPINHIWQMVKRVGRIARTDGGRDQVYIISSSQRSDVQTDHPTFRPITGCSPHTLIEGLLLEAVRLNVPFGDVHDYMVSTFSLEHVHIVTERLLEHGMVRRVDDPNDPDGLELTEKGRLTVSLPYEYRWSRLIAQASPEFQSWLCMAASFGRLEGLQSFEEGFKVDQHGLSQMVRNIHLGLDYVRMGNDQDQAQYARYAGQSFRRLEQVEVLFQLGCEALGIERSEALVRPEEDWIELLVDEIVVSGLRVGLLDLYLVARDSRGGWSEARQIPGADRPRRFVLDGDGLALEESAQGGVVAVVAGATWFTTRNGSPFANLDDVTIVPRHLVGQLVAERAQKEGWFKLTFAEEEYQGRPELRAWIGRTLYLPSRSDNLPEPGKEYWCSVNKDIDRGLKSVWIHYPVV
jgi:hypothetical protein